MKVIILAAGKGTRLHSEKYNLPKVLRKANGKSLLDYVVTSIDFVERKDIILVVGYKKDMVKKEFGVDFKYVNQDEQLGTGHAVLMAKDLLKDYHGDVLVTYGDMPLYKKETYQKMLDLHRKSKAACTVLTAVMEEKLAYGRIIRDESNRFLNVVETKDCNQEQLNIKELNAGVYVFNSDKLFSNLNKLKNDNSANEYYLTDIPKILLSQDEKVETYTIYNSFEVFGVNTLEELNFCESILKQNKHI